MRLFQLKHGQATAVVAAASIEDAKRLATGNSKYDWTCATAIPIGFVPEESEILCLDVPGPNRIFKFTSLCEKVAIVVAPSMYGAHCGLFDDREDSYWAGSRVEELGCTKDESRIVFTNREKPESGPYCWEAKLLDHFAVVVAKDKDEVIDLLGDSWRDAEINVLCEAEGQDSYIVSVS